MADTTHISGSTTETTVKPAQSATMEEYKNSGYYQNLGIDKLQEQLAGYTTDPDALRQQAEAQYRPTYDAELEAIRHQLALQQQGYSSQIAGLGTAYDQQRRRTNEAYNQSAVTLNNALTKRGLGRSSLVSTQGAYLEKQRNQALSDIDANQINAVNAINEKIALLTDQAVQSEKRLGTSYAAQIEARINDLMQKNQSAATSLQLQISTLQQQGYQAYQQWLLANREMELAEKKFEYETGQHSGSSGGSGGSYYPTDKPDDTPDPNGSSDNWLNSLLTGLKGEAPKTAPGVGGALIGNVSKPATVKKTPDSVKANMGTAKLSDHKTKKTQKVGGGGTFSVIAKE